MALALGEDGDQHVGARDFLAAGGLHMDHGALDHPLETGGRLGVLVQFGGEIGQFVLDVGDEALAQHVEIDRTGAHHRRRVRIVEQAQQQMFERRIFVPALGSGRQGAMQSLFEIAREGRHRLDLTSFP